MLYFHILILRNHWLKLDQTCYLLLWNAAHSKQWLYLIIFYLISGWNTHSLARWKRTKWISSTLCSNFLLFFNSLCQRQCELLTSLGVRRQLTFHILIFSSETPQPNEVIGTWVYYVIYVYVFYLYQLGVSY
jgi:hypothetical protein